MATRISIGSGTLAPTPVLPWTISGSVEVGDVVYQVSGANKTIARASASDLSKRPPIGVVLGISNGTADVAVHGEKISGVSGLVAGTTYWLGADGAVVDAKPGSNAYVVGVALSSTEFLVDVLSADISATGGAGGGVTSVGIGSADASLATSGGPITSAGDITVNLSTVAVADGGTGLTSASEAGAMLVASGSGAYVSQNVSPFQRNRLINAAMMVDQRNQDRMVTPAVGVYTTDRWIAQDNIATGTFLAGRNMGWSNSFDGSGDYLSVADNAALELGTSAFTIEMWVSTTASAGALVSKGANTNVNFGNLNFAVNANGTVSFACNPNAGDAVGRVVLTSTTAINTGAWFHVAITRTGTSWYLFVSGAQEATATSAVGFRDSADLFYVGCTLISSAPAQFFNGYLSNVRIVKGTALYTSAFTPQTSPLIPVANTSLLTCASEAFNDKSSNNFTVTPTGNVAVSSYSPFTNQAPAGFTGSLRWAVTTPASAGAAEYALLMQRIEGTSVYDLAWGTASARATTLSFWVRSPVTGTYCVAILNGPENRTYIAEYTISSANTWEKKTLQVAGDTTGTWQTGTGTGIELIFDLGSGSNYSTSTVGSWQAGAYLRSPNQTNFVGTALASGAQSSDFCITGVQFEAGSVATPFEVRPMQAEVALCQRYYARMRSLSGNFVGFGQGYRGGTTAASAGYYLKYPVNMRSEPVISQSNTAMYVTAATTVTGMGVATVPGTSSSWAVTSGTVGTQAQGTVWVGNNNPNAYVELDAEL